MNTSLVLILIIILIVSIVLFWLLYKNSNSTQKLSEQYLLEKLASKDLTSQERTQQEQQLSFLLQKKQKFLSNKVSILIAVIIIPASCVLYIIMGNPNAIDYVNKSPQEIVQSGNEPQMSMEEAIKQLEQKLAENPEDIDGNLLYARSQVSLKAYDKAVKAYRKVNDLAPNEPVILTELAEAIALFNNNRSFLGEPETLLKQAVEIDDTNQKALWLYGMTFYERKEFVKTNELWTNLYDLMDNENAKKQLFEQITEVRSKIGIKNKIAPDENNSESIKLTINITYDEEKLPAQKNKRATLFLYTKATTGMPMPIAVVKKQLEVIANSFPMTITLNDLNNLQDNRKLSSFESVVIGARISYSGDAIAQSGDLQSSEITVNLPYSDTIELFIDQVKNEN